MMKHFTDRASKATLSQLTAVGSTLLQVSTLSNYPPVPFSIVIDPDQSVEETALVVAMTNNSFTLSKGTVNEHKSGSVVRHAAVAQDFTDAAEVFAEVFGDPPALDPITGRPKPIIPASDYVTKSKDTWGDLLP
jgi:hypothetical protein